MLVKILLNPKGVCLFCFLSFCFIFNQNIFSQEFQTDFQYKEVKGDPEFPFEIVYKNEDLEIVRIETFDYHRGGQQFLVSSIGYDPKTKKKNGNFKCIPSFFSYITEPNNVGVRSSSILDYEMDDFNPFMNEGIFNQDTLTIKDFEIPLKSFNDNQNHLRKKNYLLKGRIVKGQLDGPIEFFNLKDFDIIDDKLWYKKESTGTIINYKNGKIEDGEYNLENKVKIKIKEGVVYGISRYSKYFEGVTEDSIYRDSEIWKIKGRYVKNKGWYFGDSFLPINYFKKEGKLKIDEIDEDEIVGKSIFSSSNSFQISSIKDILNENYIFFGNSTLTYPHWDTSLVPYNERQYETVVIETSYNNRNRYEEEQGVDNPIMNVPSFGIDLIKNNSFDPYNGIFNQNDSLSVFNLVKGIIYVDEVFNKLNSSLKTKKLETIGFYVNTKEGNTSYYDSESLKDHVHEGNLVFKWNNHYNLNLDNYFSYLNKLIEENVDYIDLKIFNKYVYSYTSFSQVYEDYKNLNEVNLEVNQLKEEISKTQLHLSDKLNRIDLLKKKYQSSSVEMTTVGRLKWIINPSLEVSLNSPYFYYKRSVKNKIDGDEVIKGIFFYGNQREFPDFDKYPNYYDLDIREILDLEIDPGIIQNMNNKFVLKEILNYYHSQDFSLVITNFQRTEKLLRFLKIVEKIESMNNRELNGFFGKDDLESIKEINNISKRSKSYSGVKTVFEVEHILDSNFYSQFPVDKYYQLLRLN